MTRYVITADVAIHLAREQLSVGDGVQLLAPALLRSQVVSSLYRSVRRGELSRAEADRCLDAVRALRLRLLGDRVLQRKAWDVADELGWDDTYDAESIALTVLQADALVTGNERLAEAAERFVTVEPLAVLLQD